MVYSAALGPLDYESTTTWTLVATAREVSTPERYFALTNVTIVVHVADVFETPTLLPASAALTVDENVGVSAVDDVFAPVLLPTRLQAGAANPGDWVTVRLAPPSSPASALALPIVVLANGSVVVTSRLNASATPSYTLPVQVVDSLGAVTNNTVTDRVAGQPPAHDRVWQRRYACLRRHLR